MKDGAARGGMDEADEIAPLVAVLHGSEGALAVETPHLVQDRLQPDAVFVDRPELDAARAGRRSRPRAAAASAFFEGLLRHRIGLHMAWARFAPLALEAHRDRPSPDTH